MGTLNIKSIWSYDVTNDPNDGTIIVYGTSDKVAALESAKDLFKREITDVNGCAAEGWGAETYNTHPDTVFVYMEHVG